MRPGDHGDEAQCAAAGVAAARMAQALSVGFWIYAWVLGSSLGAWVLMFGSLRLWNQEGFGRARLVWTRSVGGQAKHARLSFHLPFFEQLT